MDILYISHLSDKISAGPSWSVPASIRAQAKYDNVFWVNITSARMEHWLNIASFHSIEDCGRLRLKNLSGPFSSPDIVVFEGFYAIKEVLFSYELRRKRIPYVIIPRGSLTRQALRNHSWLKKKIAHWLFFNSFVKHALAIQFLTEKEHEDSIKLNKNHVIIPNGFHQPVLRKECFSEVGIKALFIGRIDVYHKGLDLLVQACQQMKEELREAKFMITCYGPKGNEADGLDMLIKGYGIEDIVKLKGEIRGKEKENAILDADVFIMTSRFEGHPMGLIEALSYGLPVLVSRGTNMMDEVQEANAGWTCENEVNSIVTCLSRLIKEKSLLLEKSRNARLLASRYDWDLLAKDFHQAISSILETSKFSV